MVKFGACFLADLPIRRTVKLAKIVDENGFDYIWVADENPSPPYRDVIATLTAIALETRRVGLGPGVCNPYTRHPALIAVAILTIDEISNGRAILGLGPGGSLPLKPLGIEMWRRPRTVVKEAVNVLRRLFAGETVDYEGDVFKTKGVKLPHLPKAKIPIYLAARGPRMLELVGEIADGVLLTSPLAYLDFALDKIKRGAKRTGRSLEEIDVANLLPFAMSEDDRYAYDMVKVDVCFMVADSPSIVLEKVGIQKSEAENIRKALKKGPTEAAKLVTDKMVDAFSIAGTPEFCVKRIEEFVKAGVTQVVLTSPFGAEPEKVISWFSEKVIPNI